MVSTPSITTIIVCAVVAGAALCCGLGGWYCYLKSRKRRRFANRTLLSGVELSNSHQSSGVQRVATGQAREISMGYQDEPSRQRDLISPFTNARDPPYPGGPSQQNEYEESQRPRTSNHGLKNTVRDTPPRRGSAQHNDDYANLSSVRHTRNPEIGYVDGIPISAPSNEPQRPSNSYHFNLPHIHYSPPSSSLPSLVETPQTSSTFLTSITEGPEYIYHSHLHPTAAATQLHAPPRHRPSSPRPSSVLSSSADSIVSNSQYVNPAYAAYEKARNAAAKGRKRRWAVFGLESEGDGSAGGSGWVIKGRSPELPAREPAHDPARSDSERDEQSAEEIVVQAKAAQDGKRRPGPISIPRKPTPRAKISPKFKFSVRPTHPASAGTPQLDTISDAPRGAPKIMSMRRPHHSPDRSPLSGGAENGAAEEDGFPDGLPNVFGRGVMTDQYFVRDRDDESFMSTPREGKRRGAVRVDGRGRIVRA